MPVPHCVTPEKEWLAASPVRRERKGAEEANGLIWCHVAAEKKGLNTCWFLVTDVTV
jgi:hypothetical protein